ncbi:MAG: radical SAM protein [Candidatus Portnoybacteria bacterium]|nr:radical SAM protein [Candidatus Portnoybacteria bacterium]
MENTAIHLAVIELTNRCNLSCKHCYSLFKGNKDLGKNAFLKTLSELKKLNCKLINFSGGEPLLLENKIFDYALLTKKILDAQVQLTTNGVLINTFNFKKIKKFSIFDNIQISLDGDERIHDKIRGFGNYKKSVRGLILLKKNNINVSVMMTINKMNLKHLDNVFSFTQEINADFSIERFTPIGRGTRFFEMLSKKEWKNVLSWAMEKSIDISDPLKIHFVPKRTKNYLKENRVIAGCSAGISAVCINVDLNVFPCPRLRIKCGNLFLTGLSNIMKSRKMIDFRNRNKLEGKCGDCEDKMICGGCRAHAFAITGNVFSEDSLCFK